MKPTKWNFSYHVGFETAYQPVDPVADTPELADASARLMYRHSTHQGLQVFIAEKGELTAGWVIGIIPEPTAKPSPEPLKTTTMEAGAEEIGSEGKAQQ